MNPQFPVYIISKARPNRNPTRKMLEKMGVDYYMVIEKEEYELYKKNNTSHGTILILPDEYKLNYDTFWHDGDKRTGPGAARNFCWEHSISNGFEYHWVLDDNIESVERLNHNMKIPCNTGTCFYIMEQFVTRFENVYLAGPAYSFFVPAQDARPPIKLNTRIYSFLLIKNDIPYRWRGRYNEDTDLSLRILKDGFCTIQFNSFLQGKRATQTVKGGNDAEFYSKEGTSNKSQMLYDMHPDCVKLVIRFNRPHHFVNYNRFQNKPKYKTDYIRKEGINEFGLELKKKQ